MSEFENDDFEGIRVTETGQSENGWTFLVEIGHGDGLMEFWVEIDKAQWTRLTGRRIEPSELVLFTFKFLLDKEAKELILKKFNLSDVEGQYPNFEMELKKSL